MNKIKIRNLSLVGLFLLVGACANVPLGDRFTTLDTRRDDKALVYIYRPYVRPSAAYGVIVNVDGIEKAILPVGAYTRFYLEPGTHNFIFSWPAISMQGPMDGALKFEAGQTYFVRYSVSTANMRLWEFLAKPVTAETAIPELQQCSYSRPLDEDTKIK